jgi:hypothetical protein
MGKVLLGQCPVPWAYTVIDGLSPGRCQHIPEAALITAKAHAVTTARLMAQEPRRRQTRAAEVVNEGRSHVLSGSQAAVLIAKLDFVRQIGT